MFNPYKINELKSVSKFYKQDKKYAFSMAKRDIKRTGYL